MVLGYLNGPYDPIQILKVLNHQLMDLLTYGSRLPEWIVQFDSDFKTIKPSARGPVDLT